MGCARFAYPAQPTWALLLSHTESERTQAGHLWSSSADGSAYTLPVIRR
jgi:hypothetical protein